MSFITAWLAIAGVGAMAIPIIIHLMFRRRRKPVIWGAMQLLLEAVRRHRRRARVEQLLLLTIRCLILLLIGLALAEPLLSGIKAFGTGSRIVVLVVDEGLVSGIRDETGRTELETTIETADRLIDELDPGDRVAIIRTSHPAREMTDGPTVDMEGARRLLRTIKPDASRTNLSAALEIADSILDEHAGESPASIILLGSWRRGSLGTEESNQAIRTQDTDDSLQGPGRQRELLALMPSSVPRTIVAIESIKLRRPVSSLRSNQPPIRTTVVIRRMGNDLGEGKSVVRISGSGIEETLPRQVAFTAGASKAVIEFTGRLDSSNATVDGTSAVVASVDDQSLPDVAHRAAVVDTSPTIQVGIVDRNEFSTNVLVEDVRVAEWIERALDPDVGGVIEVDRIDPSALSGRVVRGLDAIVLSRPDLLGEAQWQTLRDFVDEGRFVLVVPPPDLQVHSWLDRMGATFGLDWQVVLETHVNEQPVGLAADQPGGSLLSMLESELDFLAAPVQVHKMLKIEADPGDSRTMLQTSDGDPVLVSWNPDEIQRGTLALLTVAPHLSWSTLPVKPLMVPLMQELVREGASAGQDATSVIAGNHADVSISGAREITGPGGVSVPVELSGSSRTPLRRTGHWVARDTSGTPLTTIVVNAELDAADPTTVSSDVFKAWLGPHEEWEILESDSLVGRFVEVQTNPVFSLILLAVALMLLGLETALNRWFSRSRISVVAVPSGSTA